LASLSRVFLLVSTFSGRAFTSSVCLDLLSISSVYCRSADGSRCLDAHFVSRRPMDGTPQSATRVRHGRRSDTLRHLVCPVQRRSIVVTDSASARSDVPGRIASRTRRSRSRSVRAWTLKDGIGSNGAHRADAFWDRD